MKTVELSPCVADILSRAQISGRSLSILEQLDRPTYESVNRVLSAMGGKWSRKDRAHIFPVDAASVVASALNSGKAVNRQQSLQFFQTPAILADRMVAKARIASGQRVLEPSAGLGRILDPILAVDLHSEVVAVEIDEANVRDLRTNYDGRVTVVHADFLQWAESGKAPLFEVVIMNPPFTKNADLRHVLAAYKVLAPGGRIVAITSTHYLHAQEKEAVSFRHWVVKMGAKVEELPAGEFAESGTSVSTLMLTIDRPFWDVN